MPNHAALVALAQRIKVDQPLTRLAPQQLFVELLDAGQPAVIHTDRAQNVRRDRALGVVALALFLEVQRVERQFAHTLGLAGLGQTLHPLEARLRQLAGERVRIDAEHFRQQLSRGLRVRNLARENPDRIHRGAACQLGAEAVKYLTALSAHLDEGLLLSLRPLDEPFGPPNL